MTPGIFITLEGPDGCGKSTQARLLTKRLRVLKLRVLHTREPGGTAVAESIRKVLLDPGKRIGPLAELFLYEASRAQHADEIVRPALRKGICVVSERFTDATEAYQGHGRKLDLAMVRRLNAAAAGGLIPHLTVVLDLSPQEGLRRTGKARRHDRMERERLAFHQRVRAGYRTIARREPGRVKLVPASDSVQEVAFRVWNEVEKLLSRKGVR